MLYVNNEKVDQRFIDAEVERLRPEYQQVFVGDNDNEDAAYEKQLMDWSRENVIELFLFRQAARAMINSVPDDQIQKEYDQLIKQHGSKEKFFQNLGLTEDQENVILDDIIDQLKVRALSDQISSQAPTPTDDQVRRYYDENRPRFTTLPMVRASHIVMYLTPNVDPAQIQQQMNQLLWEVRNKNNFEEVASRQSDCPENAGDLGYFPKGRMVPEFDNVVFNMNPGDISDVFRTPFGFHIAKVTDVRPSTVASFEDVKERIRLELAEDFKQRQLEMFIDVEKEKAVIEHRQE